MKKLVQSFLVACALGGGLSAHAQVYFESLNPFAVQARPFFHGYNRTHIVRKGDTVYMLYNVDNPPYCEIPERGKTTIFKKVGNGAWQYGETFPTTAAGLLVDPQGVPRVFTNWNGYSPCQPNNNSGGISMWTAAGPGAISAGQWTQEWVQTPPVNPNIPVVTGRLGGGVDLWGNLYISDSLDQDGDWSWIKAPNWSSWYKQKLRNTPGNWHPYPFVQPFVPFANGFFATFNATGQFDTNVLVYPNGDWTWSEINVADNRYHQKYVVQSDTYVDTQGRLHLLYKVCNQYAPPIGDCQFDHFIYPISTGPVNTSQIQVISNDNDLVNNFNFVRLLEIDGRMFYFAGAGGADAKLYWMEAGHGTSTAPLYGWNEIDIPANIEGGRLFNGVYLFVSAPRGGGDPVTDYIDILAADGTFQPEALAVYARIPKSMLVP